MFTRYIWERQIMFGYFDKIDILAAVIFTPFTLVIDILTLPLQIIACIIYKLLKKEEVKYGTKKIR